MRNSVSSNLAPDDPNSVDPGFDPITLVNKKKFFFVAKNFWAILGYFWGADSKNDISFTELALVLEIMDTPQIMYPDNAVV